MTTDADRIARSDNRLKLLVEISGLLARFESVKRTFPKVLTLLAQGIPLRSVTLLTEPENDTGAGHLVTWTAKNSDASDVERSKSSARTLYSYLARSGSIKVDFEEDDSGLNVLPNSFPVGTSTRSDDTDSPILLPLVADRVGIFGGIQVEGTGNVDESDLAFVNTVINQVAVAIERQRFANARYAESESARAEAVRQRGLAEQASASAQRSEARQRFLSETGILLASSLDYRTTLATLVRSLVPLLADICFLDELSADGGVERLETAPLAARIVADRVREFESSAEWNLSQSAVLSDGKSIVIDDAQTMIVPLLARDKTLGALTFMRTDSGHGYSPRELLMAEDIGRRAAIAIENSRLFQTAQRSIKARQDILAVVSHDLKNPLSVIVMSVASLGKPTNEDRDTPTGKVFAAIRRSTDRMSRILGDLVDLSSIEAGRLRIDKGRHSVLRMMLETCEHHLPLAAKKEITFHCIPASESLYVTCDRGRVLQVFGNLIGNAIKFTRSGGTIEVSADERGGEILFAVRDTGPGIPSKDIPHIFDRYWQAKETARLGTGLGLSISKGLIQTHGGRLWVESKIGVGSAFYFTLAVADSAASEHGERESSSDTSLTDSAEEPKPGSQKEIPQKTALVIDDDDDETSDADGTLN